MPTFYELFRECAERWPDNVALEIQRRDRVESNTYAEARRMAESIGRWLTENGFQPGARIAILADNHPRWITAYLGIIAAGCAAVPLDTAFHADQVAKLLKDSGSFPAVLRCEASGDRRAGRRRKSIGSRFCQSGIRCRASLGWTAGGGCPHAS